MLSLGIWHRRVSLYMVYHLPEYLPGSRKRKVVLPERLPQTRQLSKMGLNLPSSHIIQGFVTAPTQLYLEGSFGQVLLAHSYWDQNFHVPVQIVAWNSTWEPGSQPSPPSEMGVKFPATVAACSFLDFYCALTHKAYFFFLRKKKKTLYISLHCTFFPSQNSQMWSKHNPVQQSICELEQTLPSLQLAMTPWSRSSSLPGSSLGFTQQLGSMQPQPVGFDCCRRRTLRSGMQSGKQASNPLCSQQTQKGSCGFKGQRVWMGVTGNLQGEFWWSWVCSGARSIPGATLLTSMPYAFSVRSSFVFSPELTGPGI